MKTIENSLSSFLIQSSLRFGFASLGVFATVALGEQWLYRNFGILGAYCTWTLLFVGLGSLVLNPLATKLRPKVPFFLCFALAFSAYALTWTMAYFLLGGRAGEWLGSLSGSIALGRTLSALLNSGGQTTRTLAVLFLSHSCGYFAGEWVYGQLAGRLGMMLWGLSYGLGFGIGLGYLLHCVQTLDSQAG